MPQLSAVIMRLPLIQGSRDKITDKLSGKVPAIPRGNGVALQCAIFLKDPQAASLVTDLSNLAAISMQVRKTSALGDALFNKSVAVEDFDNAGLAWSEWDGDTSQHFTIPLTAEETGQALPEGKEELAIYIAFEAIPISGDPFFLGSIKTSIFEDGIGSSGDPVVGDPSYLTAEETAAIYARKGVTAPDWRMDITALTGGAANALDAVATATKEAGYLLFILPATGLQGWVLEAGNDAEDAEAGLVRPDDFTEETNEKIWKRKF